ncbi:cobyric acid synthase [Profundibacterium mesophilum]|uniref:Cobyric acid synthase n=1 Tax=Profundibacterium mesophilum KAUST100406-0324 TaxID=1037889 RepID=A0A921NQA0_9RHOB|nr:cobyric acid synthase [Profundibacterium mesophilum]KAF0676776.1 Cobyric acid synthase [Profundibacterium mesophilum KAUST100406-0324]
MTRAIMIQGAGSNVGKSMIVAGLARAFTRRGLRVAPFKSQNMSNNAAVTVDGGEIGRAQALQAKACGRAPETDMNPVLLKPESDRGAQVIVQGRRTGTLKASAYGSHKATLLPRVLESFHRLARGADLVLIEGAGSPAEVNLRHGDIANMGFAEAAGIPVILIGDIDRGGVIAQCVGTHAVLPPADRDRIKGFAVNKFRGDVTLFEGGVEAIRAHTGWAPLGVIPWFEAAWRLPAEDALDLHSHASGRDITIAVPQLGRIANFDDLDPLRASPGVTVEIVPPGRPLPGTADLVLLPGSKSTIADLAAFRAQGWDIDLAAHHRRGGRVLGICGGYQMLGRQIIDADGIEGPPGMVEGLGLLDVVTRMAPEKRIGLAAARHVPSGLPLDGYEIHLGRTDGPDTDRAWLSLDGRPDGAVSRDGLIAGCYLHGLFAADGFRSAYLAELGAPAHDYAHDAAVEDTLDALADHLERWMDLDALLGLAVTLAPD